MVSWSTKLLTTKRNEGRLNLHIPAYFFLKVLLPCFLPNCTALLCIRPAYISKHDWLSWCHHKHNERLNQEFWSYILVQLSLETPACLKRIPCSQSVKYLTKLRPLFQLLVQDIASYRCQPGYKVGCTYFCRCRFSMILWVVHHVAFFQGNFLWYLGLRAAVILFFGCVI